MQQSAWNKTKSKLIYKLYINIAIFVTLYVFIFISFILSFTLKEPEVPSEYYFIVQSVLQR